MKKVILGCMIDRNKSEIAIWLWFNEINIYCMLQSEVQHYVVLHTSGSWFSVFSVSERIVSALHKFISVIIPFLNTFLRWNITIVKCIILYNFFI